MFVLASMTSFAAGMTRILTEDEVAGATRTLFPTLALVGIALLAVDGLTDPSRMETLLFRIVVFAGVAALVGIAEFGLPGFVYRDVAHLPGLTVTTEIINDTRSGFARIDGAAAHPIEYAVALASLAPLALHFAMQAATTVRRRVAAAALVAILVVNPMTVSRSGLLALAVGMAFYVVQLNARARLNGLVLAIIGLALFRAAIPGLLGTLKSFMFAGDTDPSIAGRTEDYARIPGLMDGHWLFGRGLGTFQPLLYFFLDNQYLGSLLEGGLVGLAVLIALFVVGVGLARGGRKRSTTDTRRGLGQALAACIAALAASAATFDELGFHQTGFMAFLLIGCAGAYWTTARAAVPLASSSVPIQEEANPGKGSLPTSVARP
jgi:O-antigen ligase